jgi:hypothetical protein
LELAAHIALALAAGGLGIVISLVFGVPPYTLQMALIVIAILIPCEFAVIMAWDSVKKRRREMARGILPSRAKIR